MTGVFEQAIETYGVESQLNVAIEEFAELTKEICKHKRGSDNRAAILEEMADCYIMLYQMEMIFDFSDEELMDKVNMKVKRLEKRLVKPHKKRKEDEGK